MKNRLKLNIRMFFEAMIELQKADLNQKVENYVKLFKCL